MYYPISRRRFLQLTGVGLINNFLPHLGLASAHKAKEKIVILGGGISALTTAFEITNQPNWQAKYDITLYQMGWRLGGKGASGRDPDNHQRIEEHGLHIWFGFYQNAFNLMWQVYNELDRPQSAPIPRVEDAFVKQNFAVFAEKVNDEWLRWAVDFPETDEFPGIPDANNSLSIYPNLLDYVNLILGWVGEALPTYFPEWEETFSFVREPFWWGQLESQLEKHVPSFAEINPMELFETAALYLRSLGDDKWSYSNEAVHIVVWLLQEFRRRLDVKAEDFIETKHHDQRRIWMVINLALTCIIGILKDGAIYNGLESLDDQDFQAWLLKHDAHEKAVKSTLLQSMYDSSFAYENGDTSKPSFAAGTALRVILRVLFTYKGSIIWKMKAGMGDIIFAPLYQILKERGVKFEFFHRASNLRLSADGTAIDAIEFAKQADVIGGDYNPLIMVNDLECWPNRPLYEQLVQGSELQGSGENLESRWTTWQDVGKVTLKAGVDFDKIVLGIPVAALQDITTELATHDVTWHEMLTKVKTTQTQALQLWFKPSLKAMGWHYPPAIVGSYVQEFSSIIDFTQTLPYEAWTPGDPNHPQTIIYTCGVLKDDFGQELPAPTFANFPREQLLRVEDTAHRLLGEVRPLWSEVAMPDQASINWDSLVAPTHLRGIDRLQAQYLRANIDPTERYDIAAPNTNQYRKKTDQSGFSNLFLTGTWIDSGFNFSCIEVAVMTGKQCARAVTGTDITIFGEDNVI